jgi:hypothetical protein
VDDDATVAEVVVDYLRHAGMEPRSRSAGRAADAQRCAEIHAHFTSRRHLSGGCGPVCTFGER